MNKAFILVFVAFATFATAQNPPQEQCNFEKESVLSLARAYKRMASGEIYESQKGKSVKLIQNLF